MKIGNDTVIWAKVKPDAIIPTKRDEDGWYDVYACFEEDYIEILPHSTKLIPTGIASAMSSKWKVTLGERGSNVKVAQSYRQVKLIVVLGENGLWQYTMEIPYQ